MPSASNERQIRAREDQARRDRVTEEIVIKSLMAHKDGRRWVWLRLSEAAVFNQDTNLDPAWLAYSKGLRNAGLKLLQDVNRFTPTEYVQMTNEAQEVEASITKKEPNYVGNADD